MPVRRKQSKRRSTEGLDEWFFVFSGGHDYFGELPALGIETNQYSQPSLADSEAAWQRLGEAFLELDRSPESGESWALKQFGLPLSMRSRRRAR